MPRKLVTLLACISLMSAVGYIEPIDGKTK
jgi:hypothetical protein